MKSSPLPPFFSHVTKLQTHEQTSSPDLESWPEDLSSPTQPRTPPVLIISSKIAILVNIPSALARSCSVPNYRSVARRKRRCCGHFFLGLLPFLLTEPIEFHFTREKARRFGGEGGFKWRGVIAFGRAWW